VRKDNSLSAGLELKAKRKACCKTAEGIGRSALLSQPYHQPELSWNANALGRFPLDASHPGLPSIQWCRP
jgi:hypothetical protein